jgi:aminobenzoyl-glutamate utilization protein B
MVKAGCFNDVDLAVTWHPHSIPAVIKGSSLANCRVDFSFRGRASHAAASPHLGRSALDAVELMNVGVNYLREHMPPAARIHYALIDAGGISPNVVQAGATVRYVVRDETAAGMLKLLERVRKVAAGAALMTETQVSDSVLAAVSNLVPNGPLIAAMQANLDRLGPPPFDDLDRAYAKRFRATFTPEEIADSFIGLGLPVDPALALPDFVAPADTPPAPLGGSTDVGDVSWVTPTVQLWGANYAIGTPFHSWQMVAQGKSALAYKGMIHAAMAMAATAADAFADPGLIAAAKADLKRRVGPQGYVCPLGPGAAPPLEAMAR